MNSILNASPMIAVLLALIAGIVLFRRPESTTMGFIAGFFTLVFGWFALAGIPQLVGIRLLLAIGLLLVVGLMIMRVAGRAASVVGMIMAVIAILAASRTPPISNIDFSTFINSAAMKNASDLWNTILQRAVR